MTAFFRYSVDNDTRIACLQIIERAAARVARGQLAVIDGGQKHVECSGKRGRRGWRRGRARTVSDDVAAAIERLRAKGYERKAIAEKVGVALSRVDYVLYVRRRGRAVQSSACDRWQEVGA